MRCLELWLLSSSHFAAFSRVSVRVLDSDWGRAARRRPGALHRRRAGGRRRWSRRGRGDKAAFGRQHEVWGEQVERQVVRGQRGRHVQVQRRHRKVRPRVVRQARVELRRRVALWRWGRRRCGGSGCRVGSSGRGGSRHILRVGGVEGCFLDVLLELLHVALELGPTVLEPTNHLKNNHILNCLNRWTLISVHNFADRQLLPSLMDVDWYFFPKSDTLMLSTDETALFISLHLMH